MAAGRRGRIKSKRFRALPCFDEKNGLDNPDEFAFYDRFSFFFANSQQVTSSHMPVVTISTEKVGLFVFCL